MSNISSTRLFKMLRRIHGDAISKIVASHNYSTILKHWFKNSFFTSKKKPECSSASKAALNSSGLETVLNDTPVMTAYLWIEALQNYS